MENATTYSQGEVSWTVLSVLDRIGLILGAVALLTVIIVFLLYFTNSSFRNLIRGYTVSEPSVMVNWEYPENVQVEAPSTSGLNRRIVTIPPTQTEV